MTHSSYLLILFHGGFKSWSNIVSYHVKVGRTGSGNTRFPAEHDVEPGKYGKKFIDPNQMKTKQDVKAFLYPFIEKRKAWEECIHKGRPLSELNARGIKVAKLSEVLK